MKQQSTTFRRSGSILALALAIVAVSAPGEAGAAIYAVADGPPLANITLLEDFESFSPFEFPGEPLVTGGFSFDCSACALVIWDDDGAVGFASQSLYQNGGSNSMTSVQLASGQDFSAVAFNVGNGLGAADPANYWVRAYNDGAPVTDFEFVDLGITSRITVWADGESMFDEVRVQAYTDSIQADEAQFGAISIDNVAAGSSEPLPPVPATGMTGLLILVLLLAGLGGAYLGRGRLAG